MTLMYCTPRFALYALTWASYAMSQATIRVDDSNVYSATNPTGIQYSKTGWSTVTSGDANKRYQGTYTQSRTYGSQAWFAFRGSSIAYYADKPAGFGAVTLSLDGSENINVNWTNTGVNTLYQQNIWFAGGLGPGDHTVVLGNTNVNNASIGLDYFAVTPPSDGDIRPQGYGPGATGVPSAAVLVDNESNEMSYSGSAWDRWNTDSNSTNQAMYFNNTEHCAITPGAIATFTFNGTALWYFSDDLATNSKVQFSVDGVAEQIVDTATNGNLWTGQKLFWNISGLLAGPHTVTMTHVGSDGDYACIDFYMYLPSSASTITPTPSPTITPTPTLTPIPSSKSTSVAAIAGGAAGGAAFVLLLTGLLLWYRARKHRQPHGPHHETYGEEAAYHNKPVHLTSNLGRGSGIEQGQYNPYGNMAEQTSMTQTAWAGTTYHGHPEVQ